MGQAAIIKLRYLTTIQWQARVKAVSSRLAKVIGGISEANMSKREASYIMIHKHFLS